MISLPDPSGDPDLDAIMLADTYLTALLAAPEPDVGVYEPVWDEFDDLAEQAADGDRYERRHGGDL